MKSNIKTFIGVVLGLVLWAPGAVLAAVTDLAIEPLPTLVSTKTKPNILFILDDSGSMGWDFMPDALNPNKLVPSDLTYQTTYGYKSAQCNGVAYDPTYTYVPPVKADGTNYPAASFTGAMGNGYTPKPPTYGSTYASSSTQSTTLGSKTFRFSGGFLLPGLGGSGMPDWPNGTTVSIEDPDDPNHWMVGTVTNTGTTQCSGLYIIVCLGTLYRDVVINVTQVNGSGSTSPWALTAFDLDNLSGSTYYNYNTSVGTQTKMNWTYDSTVSLGTTFKNECMSHPGSIPGEAGDGKFTGVVLTAASAEAQNYANWYQYYRTRMLMTRSGAGRAFQPLSNRYRIGFTTINDTDITESSAWADIQSGEAFLHVKDYDLAQRTAFLDRLYNTNASGGTPLRSALSKAGKYFAGQLSGQTVGSYKDPVQYACQRNYAFLSTDGYWTGSTNPTQLNGADIGQQDGADIKPFNDGGSAVRTTDTGVVDRTETTTPGTASQVYTRDTYTYGAINTGGCLASRYPETTTPQTVSTSASGNQVVIVDVTTTTTQTDSYNAGTLTTSTVVGSPVSSLVSSVAPVPPALAGTPVGAAGTPSATGCYFSFQKKGSPTAYAKLGGVAFTPSGSAVAFTTTTTTGPTTNVTGGSGGVANTLADVAEYYYMTDLRTTALGNCTAGAGGSGNVCDNTGLKASGRDEALWQHMSTFTLGLGVNGSLPYDRYYLNNANDPNSTYYKLIKGTTAWPVPVADTPTAIDDLWHTAVNGRGQYFGANNATDLTSGLRDALASMGRVPGVGAAVGVSSIKPSGDNNLVFGSSYATVDWTGDIMGYTVSANGSLSAPLSGTAQAGVDTKAWRAPNTADTRTIYYRRPNNALTSFLYSNLSTDGFGANFTGFCGKSVSDTSTVYPLQCGTLSAAQKLLANDGTRMVNWLRGHSVNEENINLTDPIYRSRVSALGDIVNSGVAYVGAPAMTYSDTGYAAFKVAQKDRKPMVYVGSNDGMLHAFSAKNNATPAELLQEMWAFVPTAVMPNMYRLANTDYANYHQYLVDGTPVTGDIQVGGVWKTILVSGLNSGGKSIFALDITNPTSPVMLWEFTDTDLGYTHGKPIITKRANGTWVVAFASGYNNTGNGYMYVLNANTGVASIPKIPTFTAGTYAAGSATGTAVGTLASPSGLARLNAWVDNVQDNTALRFYGGDLKGNVWRFDMVEDPVTPYGRAQRLATVQINSSTPQPITMRPALAEVNQAGINYPVVIVGTGRFLGASDLTDTTQQTIYAIKDPLTQTDWGDVRANASQMIAQTATTNSAGDKRTGTANSVSWASAIGWRLDLISSKERVTADMAVQYNTVAVGTGIPGVGGTCSPAGGVGWIYGIDIATGGTVSGATSVAGYNSSGIVTGVAWMQTPDGKSHIIGSDSGGGSPNVTDISGSSGSGGTPTLRRASWRELVNN